MPRPRIQELLRGFRGTEGILWCRFAFTNLTRSGVALMAIVKCGVCGGTFSDRYLRSHQRLAHPAEPMKPPPLNEDAITRQITVLFEKLPKHIQKEVIARLSAFSSASRE